MPVGPVKSNDELVDHLRKVGVLKSGRLEKAMRQVDRGLFCEVSPYSDSAQPIGFGATISQPSTIVMMTQALDAGEGDNVLEVGSGSGYQAALLWAMGCDVVSIETKSALLQVARENLEKVGAEVKTVLGDGSRGYEKKAPYDGILVTAASPSVPEPLVEQLKEGGRLVIPVGRFIQTMKVIEKTEGELKARSLGQFRFVPLVGEFGFPG